MGKPLSPPVAKLVALLKKALNHIDSERGSDLQSWAEIHDELLEEIALYDPKWAPGDEVIE